MGDLEDRVKAALAAEAATVDIGEDGLAAIRARLTARECVMCDGKGRTGGCPICTRPA